MTSPSPPRIAIVGGGPAGLTLGALLDKYNIPFAIFERHQKPTSQDKAQPSGMLDLHPESGLAALQECDLMEQFNQLSGECAEAQKVADWDGNIVYTDQGEQSERPEISRNDLTGLLSSRVPDTSIKWGHKLLSATTSSGDGGIILDFGPHGKQTFDFVVGADGAWSPVRRFLLTDIVKPFYSGTHIITTTIREHLTTKYPDLAEYVGSGSFTCLGLQNGVMAQRGPHESLRLYTVFTTSDQDFAGTTGLANQTPAVAKNRLLADDVLLGRCGPIIKHLVSVTYDEESSANPHSSLDIKPLYMLPIGFSWEHQPNATIIGDAAHLMCPWAGEGVNLAMWDALLLAQVIVKAYHGQKALDPLIKVFEEDLVARNKEKAEETYSNGQLFYGRPDGAKAMTEFFAAVYQNMPDGA